MGCQDPPHCCMLQPWHLCWEGSGGHHLQQLQTRLPTPTQPTHVWEALSSLCKKPFFFLPEEAPFVKLGGGAPTQQDWSTLIFIWEGEEEKVGARPPPLLFPAKL